MNTGTSYHGFTLIKKEHIKSISSQVYLFKHNKTGAELLHIKNKDPELLYTVAFRTPADDDTGKPHIFEHATMMSSEKYPVRDAFIGLYKSAHTSFLNAMTFPDKTVYPVGSTNKKEFKKLVDVYTDTALKPRIHEEKNIFLQEGVRFEVDNKDTLSLNGVVFNEMKGALSSPDRQLVEQAINVLFPDNTYQYCSGGLPEKIPTLSFEELTEFHTRCYHPSNAHFFFYGDVSISEYLRYLDAEYLSEYKKEKPQKITRQKTKKIRDVSREYTSAGNYEQHSVGFKLQKNKKLEDRIVSDLLMQLLMGDSQALLQKELIASGIAQDYDYMYEDEMQDLFVLFIAKNAKRDSGKKFKKIVHDVLMKISTEGFPEHLIKKVLTQYELSGKSAREATGQGLHLFRLAETAWLYGDDPVVRLQEMEVFMRDKQSYTNTFFKKYIKKLFLNNEHTNLFTLTPTKKDLQKQAIDALLEKETRKLTVKKKNQLRTQMEEFTQWQNGGEKNEFQEFFPVLSLDEIPDQEVYRIDPVISKHNRTVYLWDKAKKGTLNHVNMWFDISHISYKDMPYVELLSQILVESSTENYSSQEIISQIHSLTTGVHSKINGIDTKKDEKRAYLQIGFSYIKRNEKKVFNLVQSLLHESHIDMQKCEEIVDREIARMETSVVAGARNITHTRTFAKLYAHGTYEEYSSGIEYLGALKSIKKSIHSDKTKEHHVLKKIYKRLYTKQNMYTSLISPINNLKELVQELNISDMQYPKKRVTKLLQKKEIIISESMSNYNSYAFRIPHKLSIYEKSARSLLSTILNPNYLWKHLRDAGGAYGGALMPSLYNDMTFLSWRDPRIEGTLKDFYGIPDYIIGKKITTLDIHQAQISLFSKLDAPITHKQQMERSLERTLLGITEKEILQKRMYLKKMRTKKFKETVLVLLKNMSKGVGTTIARSDIDTKTKKIFDIVTIL